jgi:hypothetical protein
MKIFRILPIALALAAGATACSSGGVRALEDFELQYYEKLSSRLETTGAGLAEVADLLAQNEQRANREILRLRDRIAVEGLLHAAGDALAAEGDAQGRNRAVLFGVADAAGQSAATLQEWNAQSKERAKRLAGNFGQLASLVKQTVSTERTLHAYFNQPAGAELLSMLRETQRQIEAFHGTIEAADSCNPVLERLEALSAKAENKVDKAGDSLDRFLQILSKRSR